MLGDQRDAGGPGRCWKVLGARAVLGAREVLEVAGGQGLAGGRLQLSIAAFKI